jgi:hypothetical protein
MVSGCATVGAAGTLAIKRDFVSLHSKSGWHHAIKNIAAFMDVKHLVAPVAHKMVMMVCCALKPCGLVGQVNCRDQALFNQGVEVAVDGGQVEVGHSSL